MEGGKTKKKIFFLLLDLVAMCLRQGTVGKGRASLCLNYAKKQNKQTNNKTKKTKTKSSLPYIIGEGRSSLRLLGTGREAKVSMIPS